MCVGRARETGVRATGVRATGARETGARETGEGRAETIGVHHPGAIRRTILVNTILGTTLGTIPLAVTFAMSRVNTILAMIHLAVTFAMIHLRVNKILEMIPLEVTFGMSLSLLRQ